MNAFKTHPLALWFSMLALFAQTAATSDAQDPASDLSVRFSVSREEGQDPGRLLGKVTNESRTAYPCVDLEFALSTRFDMRQKGEAARPLGVLGTEVRDLQPGSVRDFEEPMPYPAGIALKSVSVCPEQPPELPPSPDKPDADPETTTPGKGGETHPAPRPPRPPRPAPQPLPPETASGNCTISGQLTGNWRQEIRERPQGPTSIWIVDVHILAHGSREPMAEATVNGGGQYEVKTLPAGKYLVRPVWDSVPREAEVTCVTDKKHTAATFRITGRPLID